MRLKIYAGDPKLAVCLADVELTDIERRNMIASLQHSEMLEILIPSKRPTSDEDKK
jgi:hypothetical protein